MLQMAPKKKAAATQQPQNHKTALLECLARAPPSLRLEFIHEVQLLAPRYDEAGVLTRTMWAASVRITDSSSATQLSGHGCGSHKAAVQAAAAGELMQQPGFDALLRKIFKTGAKQQARYSSSSSYRQTQVYGVSSNAVAAAAKTAAAAAKAAAAAAVSEQQRFAETFDAASDYVGKLQQVMQAAGLGPPTYDSEQVMPPGTTVGFTATVRVMLPGAGPSSGGSSHVLAVSGPPQSTNQVAQQAAAPVMVSSPALQQQLAMMRPIGRKQVQALAMQRSGWQQLGVAWRQVSVLPAAGPNSSSSHVLSVSEPSETSKGAAQQAAAAAMVTSPALQQELATMPPEGSCSHWQVLSGSSRCASKQLCSSFASCSTRPRGSLRTARRI
jgi:hypothetical protein